jgi:ATP-binding cassette, subfamily B, multidrug efflux pump
MGDLWRALGYLRHYWRVTLGAFASLLVVTLLSLITPQILQVLINRGISAANLSVIFYASLLLLLVAGIRNLFTFIQGFWSEKASQSAAYEMRNAIFARLEHLSFSYHDQAQTGQLLTRVTSDVRRSQ